MDVANHRVLLLIDLDHPFKKRVNAKTGLTDRRDDGRSDHLPQRVIVELVPLSLQFVIHIQGDHHPLVHVDQLRGQVEVALQVRAIHHVDHHVGLLLVEVLAHIQLLRRVGGEGVGTRQIHDLEGVPILMENALLGIDGHAAVVPHMLVGTRGEVEQRGLAAVGVAH